MNINSFFLQKIKSCLRGSTVKKYTNILNSLLSTKKVYKPNLDRRFLKFMGYRINFSDFKDWESRNNFKYYGLTYLAAAGTLYHNSEEDLESNLAHLMVLAKMALEQGDTERAEEILKIGLKLSQDHKLNNGMPFIYDVLASIALASGNMEKAELTLVEGIEALTKLGFDENNHSIIDFRLRLARIYSNTGYNKLAEIGFENCLHQQEEKINNGDYSEKTGMLYVHILFWYGIHKIRNELFTDARKLVTTAYEYSGKIKGLSPRQEMVILYTLADINLELGDYEIALSSIMDAIILGKGIGSIDLPMCYLKLGKIYEKLNYPSKAKDSYELAEKQGKIFAFEDIVTEASESLKRLNKR